MNSDTFQNLLEYAGDAIVITDSAGTIEYWNSTANQLLGYNSEEMIGQSLKPIFADWDANDSAIVESEATCKNGQRIWLERSAAVVENEGKAWSLQILRCTEVRRRRMEELEREASTDSLTGLLNRREFQRQLESSLGQPLTLAILDVDNFKDINDQFGHWVGDEAIRFVAKNLSDLFPQAICVARLGGDEFGVLHHFDSEQDAKSSFEDFQNRSIERAPEAHLTAIPKVSIGVAFSTNSGVSARELLTLADQQMYKAKSAGRNQTSSATI